jgi:tetratricopeptide (TPR) repeat protein
VIATNTKSGKMFDKYYNLAVSNLEKIIEIKGFSAEGKTLLAAIKMMRIANYPGEAPILSFKISSLLDESLKIDPENPRTFLEKGIMKYKTPAVFGGGVDGAIKLLNTSIMLFEKRSEKANALPDWGYIESLAWSGILSVEKDNYDEAEFFYNKALDIEPNFGWVKYKLLPDLKKIKLQKSTK